MRPTWLTLCLLPLITSSLQAGDIDKVLEAEESGCQNY